MLCAHWWHRALIPRGVLSIEVGTMSGDAVREAGSGQLTSLLVVADDACLREHALVPQLKQNGFTVTAVALIRDLFRKIVETPADVVLLDVQLADGDGFSAARWVREHFPTTGVILLGAGNDPHSHIRGLRDGADAYVSKSYQAELLLATLDSLLRRISRAVNSKSSLGKWRLDANGWCLVAPKGERIGLTKNELHVVTTLMARAGVVVTRDQLIATLTDNVLDFDPHRLDSQIHRVRRKVQKQSGESLPIRAVLGRVT